MLKDEIKSALDKLNLMKKREEPEEIVADMLSVLVDLGIDNITEVINKIYKSGHITEVLINSSW